MRLDEAIGLIQADIEDEDVDWDSPLGEAYKLSFEALKRCREAMVNKTIWDYRPLPGETED